MKYKVINEEILYTAEPITRVNLADVGRLKELAAQTRRRRVRLCAHPEVNDGLHEMIIVHAKNAYVRPHQHLGKSESFHLIDGRLKVVLLEDDGRIKDVLELGQPGLGPNFYYRLSEPWFHTVVPLSDWVVFHETTNGPFRREETLFADWSPAEDDLSGQAAFMKELAERMKAWPEIMS